jgi:hypothetical protein
MNSKLIIAATVAGLSLATSAFAGEGNGDPFPFHPSLATISVGGAARDTGAAQYPNGTNGYATINTQFGQPSLANNGGAEAGIQTANSLPVNALVGTAAYADAQRVNDWFTRQTNNRLAERNVVAKQPKS